MEEKQKNAERRKCFLKRLKFREPKDKMGKSMVNFNF